MPFSCSICGEESTRICVRCTKDACDNHLCEKCRKCSDCCECEVALTPHVPETVREALHAEAVEAAAPAEHVAERPPMPESPAPAEPVGETPPMPESTAPAEPVAEAPPAPESPAAPAGDVPADPAAESGSNMLP